MSFFPPFLPFWFLSFLLSTLFSLEISFSSFFLTHVQLFQPCLLKHCSLSNHLSLFLCQNSAARILVILFWFLYGTLQVSLSSNLYHVFLIFAMSGQLLPIIQFCFPLEVCGLFRLFCTPMWCELLVSTFRKMSSYNFAWDYVEFRDQPLKDRHLVDVEPS